MIEVEEETKKNLSETIKKALNLDGMSTDLVFDITQCPI